MDHAEFDDAEIRVKTAKKAGTCSISSWSQLRRVGYSSNKIVDPFKRIANWRQNQGPPFPKLSARTVHILLMCERHGTPSPCHWFELSRSLFDLCKNFHFPYYGALRMKNETHTETTDISQSTMEFSSNMLRTRVERQEKASIEQLDEHEVCGSMTACPIPFRSAKWGYSEAR
eukprot:scaffold1036_cov93-Cylindrotheca_fusiformis.AAC.7